MRAGHWGPLAGAKWVGDLWGCPRTGFPMGFSGNWEEKPHAFLIVTGTSYVKNIYINES